MRAGEIVLVGKIGSFPIAMNIFADSGTCEGTYFYKSSLRDISFEGTYKGAVWNLIVKNRDISPDKVTVSERFVLTRKSGSVWSGTWENEKHKKLSVKLTEIKQKKPGDDYRYAGIRQSLFKFGTDSVVKRGRYTIEFYHVKDAPAYSIRFTNGLDKKIAGKINNILRNNAISNAESYYACTNYTGTAEFSSSISSFFITDHLLSMVDYISFGCGGPHPDEATQPYNFNLDNGDELRLPEVLQLFDSTIAPDQGEDEHHFLTDDYTEALMELLTSLYPTNMVAQPDGQQCDYTDGMCWEYSTWMFCKDGILVMPHFQHLNMECGEETWSLIPYQTVKDFANPNYKITLP